MTTSTNTITNMNPLVVNGIKLDSQSKPEKLGVVFKLNNSQCLLAYKDMVVEKESVTLDFSAYSVIWLGTLEVKKGVELIAKNYLQLGTIYSKEGGHVRVDGGDYLCQAGTTVSLKGEPHPGKSNWVKKNPQIVQLFLKGAEECDGKTILKALEATKQGFKGKAFFEKGLGL